MESYLNKYDSLLTIYVYNFNINDGGIGDCIKFFMYLLQYAVNHNYKMYYLINNIAIEKHLRMRYDKMYITKEQLHTMDETYFIKTPYDCYDDWSDNYKQDISMESIKIPFYDVFIFSPESVRNSYNLLDPNIKKYNSIHVRLGDKFLETDTKFVVCKDDSRSYNQTQIDKYIMDNHDKNIILFSDNDNYKKMMKNKFNSIHITNIYIGHTSLLNTNERQTLDAISELYLLTNSSEIVCNKSGFALVASKFKNIPLNLI